jgi:hypothetical protein
MATLSPSIRLLPAKSLVIVDDRRFSQGNRVSSTIDEGLGACESFVIDDDGRFRPPTSQVLPATMPQDETKSVPTVR